MGRRSISHVGMPKCMNCVNSSSMNSNCRWFGTATGGGGAVGGAETVYPLVTSPAFCRATAQSERKHRKTASERAQ